jgi:hypothetical protein
MTTPSIGSARGRTKLETSTVQHREKTMKSLLWLSIGVGVGLVAAHQVNRSAAARAVVDGLSERAREFTGGVVDGFRVRDAELRDETGRSTGGAL